MYVEKDDLEQAQSLMASSSGNSAGDSVKSISGNATLIEVFICVRNMTNNRINFYQEPSNKRNKRTYPTELSKMPMDGDECEKQSCECEVNFEAIIIFTYNAV